MCRIRHLENATVVRAFEIEHYETVKLFGKFLYQRGLAHLSGPSDYERLVIPFICPLAEVVYKISAYHLNSLIFSCKYTTNFQNIGKFGWEVF